MKNSNKFFAPARQIFWLPLLLLSLTAPAYAEDELEEGEVNANEVILRGDNYFVGFHSSQITTDKNRLMNSDNSADSGSGFAFFLGRDFSPRVSGKFKLAFNQMNNLSEYSQTILGADFIVYNTDTRELFNFYVSGGGSLINNDYNLEERYTGTAAAGGSVSGSSTNFGISNAYGVLVDPNFPWLLDGRIRFRLEYSLDFDLNSAVPQGTRYFYDQSLNTGVEYVFKDFGTWDEINAKTLAEQLDEEEAERREEEEEAERQREEEEAEREAQEDEERLEAEELLRQQQDRADSTGGLGQLPLGAFPGALTGLSEFSILGDVRNRNVIYFGESSSYFNTIQRIKLLDLVEILKQNPFYRVEIIGHSEANLQIVNDTERSRFNQEISARRSLRIYNFLVRQGITENRILPIWRADQNLLNGSRTSVERAVNRRAVINLVLEQPR